MSGRSGSGSPTPRKPVSPSRPLPDIDHVLHAYKFLLPGGKLVAIMSKGFLAGEQKKRAGFRQFLAEHGKVVLELPSGTFQESGTMVETVVVELNGGPAASTQTSLLAA